MAAADGISLRMADGFGPGELQKSDLGLSTEMLDLSTSALDISRLALEESEVLSPSTITFSNCRSASEDEVPSECASEDDKEFSEHNSGYSAVGCNEPGKLKTRRKSSKTLSTKFMRKLGMKSSSSSLATACGVDDEKYKEHLEDQHTEIWTKELLPNWSRKQSCSKVRSLCFKGIPSQIRGQVWCSLLGNKLNITADLFQVLCEQAEKSREAYEEEKEHIENADGDVGGFGGKAEELLLKAISTHKMILLDLPRTYPELEIFRNENSPYRQHLLEVLEAFVCFRPEVGYSQGMSFLAALLLLYMEPADAFMVFTNILTSSCFVNFYRMKMPEVKMYMYAHEKFLKEELPYLYSHFKKLGIHPEMYMVKWIMCLFCQLLPLECTCRIWDFFFLDGDVAIFRTGLGILKLLEKDLLKMSFEQIAYQLSHLPSDIDEDELMRSVRSVQVVTNRRLKDLLKEASSVYRKQGSKNENP
ncbi:hypothetical protein NDN08_001452 [Rhodosorus marinus]|uniref:Rab-GAP TBC domain-containing protein n=1 Tax=Rhodosorus marinus TaxID=101924 RepID=A0AAV8UQU9_9RHOD|nr:hypothetical protein NDN08_001452 [Rhodosorus marinus]